MRISIDARELSRPKSGIGSYVLNLIRGLAAVDSINEYILIVTAGYEKGLGPEDLPDNFSIVSIKPFWLDKIQDQIGIVRSLRRLNCHVFHATHHEVTPLLAAVPVVSTVHDIAPIDFKNSSRIHTSYYRWISTMALKKARYIICDSDYTRSRLESVFPFVRNRCYTTYVGLNPFFKRQEDFETFKYLSEKFAIGHPYLLFVGTFARRKNVGNIIKAFQRVKTEIPNLQFVIRGHYSCKNDEFPAEIPPGVVIMNAVNDRELRALYNNAQLLLLVSRYEGFGVPVAEAMACGCPVVTSARASLPEVGGDAVLYADPESPEDIAGKIEKILSNEKLREEIVQKGAAQAARFNRNVIARNVIEIYRKCTEGTE